MLKRAATTALIAGALGAALLSPAARPARAQSVGDLSGSRAMAYIAVTDLPRARAFYGQVLGLRIISSDTAGFLADAGGVRIRVNHADQPATANTVLGFEVADIYTITKRLSARGVKFLRMPGLPTPQDANAMWTMPNGDKEVWFKDPDGNVISLSNGGSGL